MLKNWKPATKTPNMRMRPGTGLSGSRAATHRQDSHVRNMLGAKGTAARNRTIRGVV